MFYARCYCATSVGEWAKLGNIVHSLFQRCTSKGRSSELRRALKQWVGMLSGKERTPRSGSWRKRLAHVRWSSQFLCCCWHGNVRARVCIWFRCGVHRAPTEGVHGGYRTMTSGETTRRGGDGKGQQPWENSTRPVTCDTTRLIFPQPRIDSALAQTTMSQPRELFGGAILMDLPAKYIDASYVQATGSS